MQIEKFSTDLPPSGAQILDLTEQIGTSLYTNLCFTCIVQSLKHRLKNFYLFNDQFQVDALAGLRGARHASLVASTARAAAHWPSLRLMCLGWIMVVDSDGGHFFYGILV